MHLLFLIKHFTQEPSHILCVFYNKEDIMYKKGDYYVF